MTDFRDPAGASLRLSNQERDEAVAALNLNASHGRLTDTELASRTATARAAVTRGDLAPLFADLPVDAGTATTTSPAAARRGYDWIATLRYVSPLVAVILFFLTGWVWGFQYSWIWFLLVPIVWGLASGVDGSGWGRDRRRDRNR